MPRTASEQAVSSSRRIRILHIISDLCVAGAEMKLYKLLAATNRERFAPAVISMKDQGELRARIEALGVPVYTLGIRGSLPGPLSVIRLIRIVRRFQPELIHGWMYHGNLAAQVAAVFSRRKPCVLWSIHQSLYNFDYEKRITAAVIKLCALVSKLPDKIIYISHTSATQHERVGYDEDKELVLYYGFDTEKFAPSREARRSVRAELGVAPDTILIGLVGRYHPVKDHGNFLRAAALVSKSDPETQFVMCGKGIENQNPALRGLIDELQLASCVQLLGQRHDIQRVMAALDVAASSSCSEGFPNVIGEAMSSGVPCVGTAVSDLPEIVGATGRVVPPKDAAALAAALVALIELGASGRTALGTASRARVIENYSLESTVANYEGVYERAMTQARADAEGRSRSAAERKRIPWTMATTLQRLARHK